MTTLIEKLKQLFLQRTNHTASQTADDLTHIRESAARDGDDSVLTDEMIAELVRQIEKTQEGMYSCSESFMLLDEYADMITGGEDAARLMPLVKAHLDHCPDCHEAYDMLLSMLQADEQT